MQTVEARTAAPSGFSGFVDEICGTLARLIAYVCTLALMAILGIHLWDRAAAAVRETEPAAKSAWSMATRSVPAFAVSQFDLAYKTDTYQILRHPEGGRRDVLRWLAADGQTAAELDIYRPGGEASDTSTAIGEAAGIIDSKFGPVTVRLMDDAAGRQGCLSFFKGMEQPLLRISGWSCQGDSLAARRMAIACTLNRLALLSAGNDHKLAELFAHAELRRTDCAAAAPARSTDWVTGTDNPRLRSTF